LRRRVGLAIAGVLSLMLSAGLIVLNASPASADVIPGTHVCEASVAEDGYRGVVCVDLYLDFSVNQFKSRAQTLCQSVSSGNTVQCAGITMSMWVINEDNGTHAPSDILYCGRDTFPTWHNPPCPSTGRFQALSPGATAHCTHVYRAVATGSFKVPVTGDQIHTITVTSAWGFPCR
jgi:hypothetical protein